MRASSLPIHVPIEPEKISDFVKVRLEEKDQEDAQEIAEEEPPTPPSLEENLSSIDRVFIRRRMRVRSVFYLKGQKNTFYIQTTDGTEMYTIFEERGLSYFFNGFRPLELHIVDPRGTEVIRMTRGFDCLTMLNPCRRRPLDVFFPPDNHIGTVQYVWHPVMPEFIIRDEDGEEIFDVQGPKSLVTWFRDEQYHITRMDGTPVGAVCKRWNGLAHRIFVMPIVTSFGLAFENDLSLNEKVLLLGASLLIEYVCYDA